jgi:sugar/nucleoside kinase (ribokinase family)
MKIICIGNAAYDVTLPVNHYPVENKKIRLDAPRVECGGGSASNCAYLLAKWGMETYFAGAVGDDYYGNRIIEEFEKVGVNTKYIEKKKDVPTTSSFIIANTSIGSRTILTDKSKDMVMKKREIDDDFDVILLDGYERDFAVEVIKKNPNAIKIIDAGSLRENTVELAKMVDYVVCSNDFAMEFTKKKIDYTDMKTLIEIYDDLKKEFSQNVVITLEDKGCFTYDDGYKMVPSIKVKSVDSTGAGDIYHGAFTYCIANGYDIITTMKMSNITGALSVTRVGGRFSIFTLEEVKAKYDELTLS